MAICGCPDAVIYTLRSQVGRELDKVRSIKRATSFFDNAVKDTIGVAGPDIDAASSAIPSVSPVNFTSFLSYLTCPLTILALGLSLGDLTSLDPNLALNKLKDLQSGSIESARKSYEDALRNSINAKMISVARKYVNELLRIQFDVVSFSQSVVISASVLAFCGEGEYNAGPYAAFANEIQDFSFNNGVPSTLSNNSAAVVQKLLLAENKFKLLRKSLV